jgi:ABC-2 type transport system permease protein
MLLALLRDPGALVMAFVMPAAFFVIFAEIFANAGSGDYQLHVAVLDEVRDTHSRRLLAALRQDPTVHGWIEVQSRGAVLEAVRHGAADAGLVVRADGETLDSVGGFGAAPLLVYADPSSAVAGSILVGRLQQAYATALPELLVGRVVELVENEFTEFSERQQTDIRAGLADMGERAARNSAPAWSPAELVEEQAVSGRPAARNHVAYYAGAIAFMFLLLSASQGALTLIEERDNGVLDRIAAGPGGANVVVNGKFLYLWALGLAQTALIFAIATLAYKVDVPYAFWRWLATALLSSAAAAAIALALISACRSRAQAQALSTTVILVMSAIGGSMVPRFFMPEWLQGLGWITPNTWVLEIYSGVLWRDEGFADLLLPGALLLLVTLVALLMAHVLARRMT